MIKAKLQMQLGFNCFTTTRLMIGAFFLWGRFLCDRFSAAAYNVRGASERTPAKLLHTPKTNQTDPMEVSYELPLQSLRRRQHVVDHHYPAPCSFLLRLRITDIAAADAHPPAGTITDVEMIPPAADADAMTDLSH